MLSLKRAAWSFKVLPNDAVVSRSALSDQYPEPPACRIGAAAASDIFHLPFSPLSPSLQDFKGEEDVDMSSGLRKGAFKWSAVCAVLTPLFTPKVRVL